MPLDIDIFLSYHWRDHAQVEALAQRLREQKLTVFLDRWYLTLGQSWPKALESAIAQCKAVAVCIGQGELRKSRDRVWEVATIVPTDRPIHALAAVLLPLIETDMSEIIRLRETNQLAEDLLSRKTALRGIVDLVLKKQPGTDRLLLIADQWEELFTLCTDEAASRGRCHCRHRSRL